MVLSEDLLKLIVCPKCKGELIYLENEKKLNCENCRLSYRIEDDIPILFVEDAESY